MLSQNDDQQMSLSTKEKQKDPSPKPQKFHEILNIQKMTEYIKKIRQNPFTIIYILASILLLSLMLLIIFYNPNKLDKVYAGQIHYSRIPEEYWQHRIKMVKSMGMNALSVYVMWNYHEVQKGIYDFQGYGKNLGKFLELAKKQQMKVLIRPGPYVCAEWDFGGMPARLLAIKDMKIRSSHPLFIEEVKIYFKAVSEIIRPHLQQNGGNIILLQIQNQYGFYGKDPEYFPALRQIWNDLEVYTPQYYVDWVQNVHVTYWPNSIIGINDLSNDFSYKYVKSFAGRNSFIFGGEIYSGWLVHWGETWNQEIVKAQIAKFEWKFSFLVKGGYSFAMYMAHGGSNFGLTAGANGYNNEKYDYRAAITSYDYRSPINEQGSITEKYKIFQNLTSNQSSSLMLQAPKANHIIQIPDFKLIPKANLFSNLGDSTIDQSLQIYPFESDQLKMFNQGFVLYETNLKQTTNKIRIVVHDYALVYLDNALIHTLNRSEHKQHFIKILCKKQIVNVDKSSECHLQILVEAMGHINFGHQMQTDKKGLIEFTHKNKNPFHLQWTITKVPIDKSILDWQSFKGNQQKLPILYKGKFALNMLGDTYLQMQNFGKGYLWVNGKLLGRYWGIGPVTKLFCPGVWLKKGINRVYVLEMERNMAEVLIRGEKTLIDFE